MNNNPFRSVPSKDVNQHLEDWGKRKFKPQKLGDGRKDYSKKRFGANKTFNRKFNHGNKAHKFNEVSNEAEPFNGTPWNKYKDELVYKQREEEQAALQANMESDEAKAELKKREINYKKSLIQQKKQETTEWEDFGDEEQNFQNKTKADKFTINQSGKSLNMNGKKMRKQISKRHNKDYHSKGKFNESEFISKELLSNFDSKKLNYKQNDKLRATITKTTMMASGDSLKNVVKAIKRKKAKNQTAQN